MTGYCRLRCFAGDGGTRTAAICGGSVAVQLGGLFRDIPKSVPIWYIDFIMPFNPSRRQAHCQEIWMTFEEPRVIIDGRIFTEPAIAVQEFGRRAGLLDMSLNQSISPSGGRDCSLLLLHSRL